MSSQIITPSHGDPRRHQVATMNVTNTVTAHGTTATPSGHNERHQHRDSPRHHSDTKWPQGTSPTIFPSLVSTSRTPVLASNGIYTVYMAMRLSIKAVASAMVDV